MRKIKDIFRNYSSRVELSEAKKKELWSRIADTGEKSFSDKLAITLKRFAPALFSVGMVYVGVSYYKSNVLVGDKVYYEPMVQESPVIMKDTTISSNSLDTFEEFIADGEVEKSTAFIGETKNMSAGVSEDYLMVEPTNPIYIEGYPEDNTVSDKERAKDIDADFYYLVDDVKFATDTTYTNIVKYDGIVISSSLDVDEATFIARIPTDKFEEFRSSINGIAKVVKTERVDIQDKQDEISSHNDTISEYEKEIKNLKAKLAKETNTKKKAEIRAEIEKIQDKVEFTKEIVSQIEEDVSMANVTITYRIDTETFAGNLKYSLEETFVELGDATVTLVNGTIIGIFFAIPITLVYLAVRFVVRRVKGRN